MNRQCLCDLLRFVTILGMFMVIAGLLVPTATFVFASSTMSNCVSNLSQMGKFLTMYRSEFGSYPPADGGTKENWARYIQNTDAINVHDRLFVCPNRKRKEYTKQPSYFFANAGNETFFPRGQFSEEVDAGTPIMGDAYDPDVQYGNHGPMPESFLNVLLFNDSTMIVQPGDATWNRAYEQKSINGTFDASALRRAHDRWLMKWTSLCFAISILVGVIVYLVKAPDNSRNSTK